MEAGGQIAHVERSCLLCKEEADMAHRFIEATNHRLDVAIDGGLRCEMTQAEVEAWGRIQTPALTPFESGALFDKLRERVAARKKHDILQARNGRPTEDPGRRFRGREQVR